MSQMLCLLVVNYLLREVIYTSRQCESQLLHDFLSRLTCFKAERLMPAS
jgi:hypothetical protein